LHPSTPGLTVGGQRATSPPQELDVRAQRAPYTSCACSFILHPPNLPEKEKEKSGGRRQPALHRS